MIYLVPGIVSLLAAAAPVAGETPASAETPASGDTIEEPEAWIDLDREIAILQAAAAPSRAMTVSADFIATYAYSDDVAYTDSDDDLSGFDLRRARLTARTSVGDFDVKIQIELADGDAELKDGYIKKALSDNTSYQVGQYKSPLLHSGYISRTRNVFFDKTNSGGQNDNRELGVMLMGDWNKFGWFLSAQNGEDDQKSKKHLVGRFEFDFLGEGAFGQHEGAYGYGESTQFSVAIAASDDGAIDNGDLLAADARFVADRVSFALEAIEYDQRYDLATGLDPDEILGTSKADTTPWSVTGSYVLGDDDWEVVYRLEKFDDVSDTERVQVGLLRFVDGFGHKAKWSLIYSEFESDDPSLEGDRIEFGITLNAN
ncbi:MAG: hypothetical protein O7B99_12085 [Planctomycetota bacterium]|nr:hypothetical protein [Planctomycetota bacterium]